MSKRPLRVAQIGCSPWGLQHLETMLGVEGIEVVALCARNAERLAAAASKFNLTCPQYSDMAKMIRDLDADLVNIVTTPSVRLSIIEAAIEAGARALLIEKPMALSSEEAQKIVALGQDRLIAVNTQYQWMNHWQRFWALLEQGALGPIRAIRGSTGCNLLEQGPHVLDLALKAARVGGLPAPEWVLASCDGVEHVGEFEVPASTSAMIALGDVRLHFNAGLAAPPVPGESVIWFQQQVEVIGDNGRLWVSLNQGWKLWLEEGFQAGETCWPRDGIQAQQGLFTALRDTLLGAEDAWRKFPTRAAVAANVGDVLFACIASARSQKLVRLEPDT